MKSRIIQDTKILFLVGIAGVALMLSLGACGAGDLGSDTALAADASVGEMQNIDLAPMAEVGDDHTHAPGTDDQHSHDDVIEIEEGQTYPTVVLNVEPDPMSGWNVHVQTTNFRFTPENASSGNVLGEGHAHLYVDGEKLARLYGEWFHIAQLEPGTHEVAVSLNGNSHAAYYYAGEPVEASVTIEVPLPEDPGSTEELASEPTSGEDHSHAPGVAAHSHDDVIEIEEGQTYPTVVLNVEPDPMSGWNVHVQTTNFRFTPENASSGNILGEGHAHLYVDGEKLARLYGEWFHIGKLDPGTHDVVVSLNGNSHAAYYYAGEPVEASVTVEVEQ